MFRRDLLKMFGLAPVALALPEIPFSKKEDKAPAPIENKALPPPIEKKTTKTALVELMEEPGVPTRYLGYEPQHGEFRYIGKNRVVSSSLIRFPMAQNRDVVKGVRVTFWDGSLSFEGHLDWALYVDKNIQPQFDAGSLTITED